MAQFHPATLRSLRGPIRGAPPLRMGGPTEQYMRSRGQQKSSGLGQLYAQPQAPEFTGWQPGPLQTDPIRRVTDIRDPTIDEEREEEGRRLRQQLEIREEFEAPPRAAAAEARLSEESRARDERAAAITKKEKAEAGKTAKLQTQKEATYDRALDSLARSGIPWNQARIQASRIADLEPTAAGQAISGIEKRTAENEELERKAEQELKETGRLEAAKKMLPPGLREATGPGGIPPTSALIAGERRQKAATPGISPEEQKYRDWTAEKLWVAEQEKGAVKNVGRIPQRQIRLFQQRDEEAQSKALDALEAAGKWDDAAYLQQVMEVQGRKRMSPFEPSDG